MEQIIPKLCHFYWDGSPMSYLQYLTIVSFGKHNPDWKVILWMPATPNPNGAPWETIEQKDKYTGENWLEKAKALCEVSLIDVEEKYQHIHEVQKSDLLRWKILWEQGGVWSDLDILFIRPLDKILKEDFDFTISYHDGFYIGFFITKPNESIFFDVNDQANGYIRNRANDSYQALGARLWAMMYTNLDKIKTIYFPSKKILDLPKDVVYSYTSDDVRELFFGEGDKTTEETIGIHWYNGHPLAKKYQNNFEEYRYNKSVISKYVKEYDV